MTSRSSCQIRTLSVVASCVLLVVSTVTLHADYKESYRKGKLAADTRQWDVVIRYMTEAIAEQPREGGDQVKIYGLRFEPYIPHYYLGLALQQQGDCGKAVIAWKESERQGFINSQRGQLSTLQKGLKTCEAQLALKPEPTKPDPTKPDPTKPDPAKVEPTKVEPTKVEPAKPPPTKVEPAKPPPAKVEPAKVEPAKPPPPGPTPVTLVPSAEAEARRAFEGDLAAVRSFVESRRYADARAAAARARALKVNDGRVEAAVKQIDTAEAWDQLRAAREARQWADAQRLVARLEELGERGATLDEFKLAVARATEGMNVERNALGAFYRGDYRQALTLLSRISGGDAQPSPRVYLYMACSETALALLEGKSGQSRMDRARTLFAKARPRDNDFSKDRQFISPRLLQELDRNPR